MSCVLTSRVPGAGADIPVLSISAAQPGPSVVITANLHGDECTGIAVVHRLRASLPGWLLRGAVHLYPSLNPEGLRRQTRTLPGAERDLNRVFPGRAIGDRAERHAWRLWRDILSREPSLLIDLHTDSGAAIPYAIVDRVVKRRQQVSLAARCQTLAAATGLTVLQEYPESDYIRYKLDQSLSGALINQRGIAAVTLEVGPRRYIRADAVEAAFSATAGVLTAAGLLHRPASPHPSRHRGGPWRRGAGPTITAEGVLVPAVRPGQRLSPRDRLGEVVGLDGQVRQELRCTRECVVVAFPERSWVKPGQSAATLGVADHS